jgi:hypothetical protein
MEQGEKQLKILNRPLLQLAREVPRPQNSTCLGRYPG